MEKFAFLIQLFLEVFRKTLLKILKRLSKYIKRNFIYWKNYKETASIANEMRCRLRTQSGFTVSFFAIWVSQSYSVSSMYTFPIKIYLLLTAALLLIFSRYEFIKAIRIQEKLDKNS
jgi:hypothetical protein